MKIKNKLTLWAIDIFKYPLLLIFDKCTLDRAWLLQTFKGSLCRPSFCDTPDNQIQLMIDAAKYSLRNQYPNTRMLHIIEPSFGGGAMLKMIDANFKGAAITGIELDAYLYAQVYAQYKKHGAFQNNFIKFFNSNFVDYDTKKCFHLVIMNPPYDFKRFLKHIEHAIDLLLPGGVLVALLPESTFYSVSWNCINFRSQLERYQTEVTRVGTKICNYPVSVCMMRIVKEKPTIPFYLPAFFN